MRFIKKMSLFYFEKNIVFAVFIIVLTKQFEKDKLYGILLMTIIR